MMHAGAETAFSVQSILLLLTWIDITSAGLPTNVQRSNPLGIDWSPAPPPADGPPLSAGASRNKALLPAQISGIVGAYLFALLVVAIGIFFARRHVRGRIELAYRSRDIEMLDTTLVGPNSLFQPGSQDTSPVSPLAIQTNFSWPIQEKSPQEKGGPTPYVFLPASPRSSTSPYSPTTPPSLGDPNVDSRIVERDQRIMERNLEDIYAHVMEQEDAKAAGIAVQDLPPPTQLRGVGPTPPPNPQRIGSPPKKIEKQRPSNIVVSDEGKPSRSSRASSIISSIISPKKSSFKKELQISSPLQPPRDATYNQKSTAEEREPLSPRYYAPPPPPPVPKDQVPFQPPPRQGSVVSQTRTIAEQLEPYGPGAQSAFPNKTSSPVSFASQISGPSLPSSPRPQQSHFPPSTYSASPSSATSSTRQLPLRQFEPALTSPSYASFQQSTKTTVFERKTPDPSRGPATGGLRTGGAPWSPGAVPYSPYQPFSPVIPITPRLVTKEDRKIMKKQEKKLGIVQSPELVEDDLWDSGY